MKTSGANWKMVLRNQTGFARIVLMAGQLWCESIDKKMADQKDTEALFYF